MLIGLVVPSLPSYSETFFQNKIKGLKENGHHVILFIDNRSSNYKYYNGPVKYAPNLSRNIIFSGFNSIAALLNLCLFSFKSTQRFWQLEKANGSSFPKIIQLLVINSHILNCKLDWLHFGFTTMGINRELVGKALGAKMAVSFRGYDISIYPLKHPGCYDQLWNNLDKVHTISDDLLNEAYQLGLPITVETVKITPAIEVSHFIHTRTNYFENKIIRILTVGRLHWKKGHEYILEALSKVKNSGYSIEYTMVGSGEEYERLVFAVFQLGLTNEVKFIGKKEHHEIPNLMASHDVYIQYSVQEGFCNAVIEAQAAGMLCIVSDAEGLSENVLHEKTGWVVTKRQPELLADQILSTITMDQELLDKIRVTAVQRVTNNFNLEKQKIEFEQFYSM
jgi:colanic acid/amylovoran biosynthesis glycosyltransferase